MKDVSRYEPQVQVCGLGVRNGSQSRFCLLKLWLSVMALGAMSKKLPKHDRGAHPVGKRWKDWEKQGKQQLSTREECSPSKNPNRDRTLGAEGLGQGWGVQMLGAGFIPSGAARWMSWRQPWGEPCFVDTHQAASPGAMSMGLRVRAAGLPREGVSVPAVEHCCPPQPGSAEAPGVLGRALSPPASGPPAPPQLSTVSSAGLWHHQPHLCLSMGPPICALPAPKAGLPRVGGIFSIGWRWGVCGSGYGHKPIAEALANLPSDFPRSVQCWYSDALSSLPLQG